MTVADIARANALQVEAKKHALRQQQDGCWILTLKVHQHDMPQEIMTAAMGARYVMALVEIGDDEQPLPQRVNSRPVEATPRPAPTGQAAPAGDGKRPFADIPAPQQAGMLSQDRAFRLFLAEQFEMPIPDPDEAASVIRHHCEVKSRAHLTSDNAKWSELVLAFRLWQRHPELSPA